MHIITEQIERSSPSLASLEYEHRAVDLGPGIETATGGQQLSAGK